MANPDYPGGGGVEGNFLSPKIIENVTTHVNLDHRPVCTGVVANKQKLERSKICLPAYSELHHHVI